MYKNDVAVFCEVGDVREDLDSSFFTFGFSCVGGEGGDVVGGDCERGDG